MNHLTIFDEIYPKFKITKPIRLIEFFGGYGSQALALKYLGVKFEHWKLCEWAVKSIQAYKDIHFTDDNTDYLEQQPYSNKEEWLTSWLFEKGISSNYNEPMTKQQIERLSEEQLRNILNNIYQTNNLVNIQQVKGKDLEIVDTDKYDYILTYSFPCQDLSLAGKGKGMSDTSTRSGMLWEVERILTECYELGSLPQILLMENVPQVHSQDNLEDFNKWKLRLEELGYNNYFQDLIATDYGIPQTRNRCFMVSILGDYSYTFPKPIPLKLKLKDMLEDNVDEKYYLSEKGMQYICGNALNKELKDHIDRSKAKLNKEIAYTINTKQDRRCGDANFILDGYGETTIEQFLKIKNATKKGYLEATDGDGIDLAQPNSKTRRGRVQKNSIQTLTTQNNLGVCIGTYQYAKSDNFMQGKDRLQLGKEVSDTLQTTQKEGVVTIGNYTPSNHNASRIVDQDYCSPTVMENHGTITATQTSDLRIRKLTPRECFRLMGVKDEDFENCAKNQSDSSLYHLAGDSLVTLVFCAIMSTMIDNCKSFEQVLEEFYLQISN